MAAHRAGTLPTQGNGASADSLQCVAHGRAGAHLAGLVVENLGDGEVDIVEGRRRGGRFASEASRTGPEVLGASGDAHVDVEFGDADWIGCSVLGDNVSSRSRGGEGGEGDDNR